MAPFPPPALVFRHPTSQPVRDAPPAKAFPVGRGVEAAGLPRGTNAPVPGAARVPGVSSLHVP
eukprot:1042989-Alexandrium_andersonii.AAC.1